MQRNLRQRQVGLRQTTGSRCRGLSRCFGLHQVQVVQKIGLRAVPLAHFHVHRTLQQQGRGIGGLQLADVLQCGNGFRMAFGQQQRLYISHAKFRAGLIGQMVFHQIFGLGYIDSHQAQGQPGRMILVLMKVLALFGRIKGRHRIARTEPQAPQRRPDCGAKGRLIQQGRQGFLNDRHGEFFVAGAFIQRRDGPDGGSTFLPGCQRQHAFERLLGVSQAVQAQ